MVPLRHFSRDDMPNALLAGTRVLTLEGEMPVEYLSPGDRIITRDRGMVTLDDLRIMRGKVPVITIRAGSLGHMRPEADADLPASQEVLIRDWRAQALYGRARAMVPAERLVDGEFIRPAGLREVTLVALVFSEPHVIYAEGLELAAAVRETSAT
ncbi:Hint domain-containing protein [Roseivivax sp. GX 12232]|uniref:Hint domain-containing protein n=1 Tax=Roseivivax sp. GX 12232 TaxID=2900547 RepID=UPI001E5A6165|nr:Hint domain-containing protein [Roseivivax sp. GX 12232]